MFCNVGDINSLACYLVFWSTFRKFQQKVCPVFDACPNCFYIALRIELTTSFDSQMPYKPAKSLPRRSPRNHFLPAQYVGIRWRSLPQRLVAMSSATCASSRPSRFRRNALLAGRGWKWIALIVFTFRRLLVKVSCFTYLMACSKLLGQLA